MITYEQALTANHFEHVSLKNADGTVARHIGQHEQAMREGP